MKKTSSLKKLKAALLLAEKLAQALENEWHWYASTSNILLAHIKADVAARGSKRKPNVQGGARADNAHRLTIKLSNHMETPTHTAPPVALDRLVRHLIYGDIEEVSLAILGEDCPSHEEYNGLDVEQQTRLAAAATVAACLAGVLPLDCPNDQAHAPRKENP